MKKILPSLLLCLALLLFTRAGAQPSPNISKWKLADLEAAIRSAEGPTIFNFWATFCKPCIEELPYFQKLAKKYDSAGLRLVLVSLDLAGAYPEKIRSFAKKRSITAPIRFLDETNADLFCPAVDASWSGAIPASLFINKKTGYRHFYEAQLTPAQLDTAIREMIRM